jgi:thiol-disulfide isomerase/thioredoxin
MLCTLLVAPLLQAAPQAERPFPLMLGDRAPAIQVAEWVQGTPVTRFEPGKLYVVEFWATWCGPCKIAIPHLNELSKKYAGKVQFVGVSVWENIDEENPYSVPQFVKRMGENMTYTVAADVVKPSENRESDGPMATTWMKAAGQNGIPAAFIVNGESRIAWIGNPLGGIDEALADIVEGRYDIEAAAKKYALDMRVQGILPKLREEITRAKKSKDFTGAIQTIESAIAKDPGLEAYFGTNKYLLLLDAQRTAEAATYGQRLVTQVFADNAMMLNALAWTIVDPGGKVKQGDYPLAVRAAERAVELLQGKDASTMDTLGLALFKSGQVARAIEVQEKAVALAKDEVAKDPKDPKLADLLAELRSRLDEFKNAKKSL